MTGIKVYTTTGNTYTMPRGDSVNVNGISPTGELAITVFAPGSDDEKPWLASFGSVEAVYKDGTAVMTKEES